FQVYMDDALRRLAGVRGGADGSLGMGMREMRPFIGRRGLVVIRRLEPDVFQDVGRLLMRKVVRRQMDAAVAVIAAALLMAAIGSVLLLLGQLRDQRRVQRLGAALAVAAALGPSAVLVARLRGIEARAETRALVLVRQYQDKAVARFNE